MKKLYILLLTLVSTCIFLPGCAESECPLTTISVARFNFLDSRSHAAVTFKNGVTVTGIAIIDDTLNIDTLFNKAQNYMSIPLSYTNQTTYVMHYTETMRDTIEVTHKNIPYVSDIECGAMMFYEIEKLRYTTNALDSVTLVNPKITNEETTNFNIYYRASDAG